MLKAHEDWIMAKFSTAELETEPFPYIYIRDILPLSLYQEMAAATPSERMFRRAVTVDQIWRTLTTPRIRFWRPVETIAFFNVSDQGAPDRFTAYSRDWHKRFTGYIDLIEKQMHERLGTNVPWEPGQRVFFYRPVGWSIAPHTHPKSELTNAMIYFPTVHNMPEQGTLLYRPRPDRSLAASSGTDLFSRQDLEPTTIIPFLPNTLIAWINSAISVHGTVEVAHSAARRYLYFVSNIEA
jgi:hypothetical protein